MAAENTAGKQRGQPFRKGQSGNPRGRPAGARNAATVIAEQLLDGEAEHDSGPPTLPSPSYAKGHRSNNPIVLVRSPMGVASSILRRAFQPTERTSAKHIATIVRKRAQRADSVREGL